MRLRWHLVLCLALAVPGGAQSHTRQDLAEILGFENGQPGAYPAGWGGGPADTIFTHDQIAYNGRYAARIELSGVSSATFSTLTTSIPRWFQLVHQRYRSLLSR